jgi:hypothetical protein
LTTTHLTAKWATIVVIAVLLFGGLYLAIHHLMGLSIPVTPPARSAALRT